MRAAFLILIPLILVSCATSGNADLVGDFETPIDDEVFDPGEIGDEFAVDLGDDGFDVDMDVQSGGSVSSALDDHVRSCLSGWSFTGRALSRRVSTDMERLFGK